MRSIRNKPSTVSAGFSIVELLVVIVIVAVLGMVTAVVINHRRTSTHDAQVSAPSAQSTKNTTNADLKTASPVSTAPTISTSPAANVNSSGTALSSPVNSPSSLPVTIHGSKPIEIDVPGSDCMPTAGYMCPGSVGVPAH